MSAAATFASYERAVRGLGRIVERGTVGGVPYARVRMTGGLVGGAWNSAKLLLRQANADAERPEVVAIAMHARRLCGGDRAMLARLLHRFVQERVAFAREPGERFAGSALTLAAGFGDCDDSSRLLYALALAAGLPARLCFLVQQKQPAHVFCQIGDGAGYHNAETTIAALWDEHPLAAAKRLGMRMRPDLSGRAVTLGSLGASLIVPAPGSLTRAAFAVRNGDRLRMILEVSMLATPDAITQGLKAIGFAPVTGVYADRAELDLLEWPASWLDDMSTSPASDGRMLMYADATYAGAASQLNRTLDFAFVRDARKVLMESTPPSSAPSQAAPIDPNAKPLTAESLPELLPDPADGDTQSSRSAWARTVLMHAWFELFGSDPAAPYSPAVEQGCLAICDLETMLGRSVWSDPVDSDGYSLRWNFGNVHCSTPPVGGVCIKGCKKHGDSTNAGAAYVTCFAAYTSAVDGMKGFLRTLCGRGRENTRAALLTGDAVTIANAMRENGYYGYAPPKGDATDAARDRYAAAIEARAKIVADKLAAPVAVARGGVHFGLGGALVVGLLAAATIAGAIAAVKGG